jgi:putative transposase
MILPCRQSEKIDDPLTEIAREGARRMLAEALVAEADAFVASFSEERLADGRQRIVRHGFGPERQLQTGICAVEVRRPKVRDRISSQPETAKVRFTSNNLPKWARRSASLDALLPVLYLRGISTGDFQEALSALLGADAPNLSPSVITRLTAGWQARPLNLLSQRQSQNANLCLIIWIASSRFCPLVRIALNAVVIFQHWAKMSSKNWNTSRAALS